MGKGHKAPPALCIFRQHADLQLSSAADNQVARPEARAEGGRHLDPRVARRFEGFGDKILAFYSRGLSKRDIGAHLEEIYGVSVGRDLISRVTDAVMDDASPVSDPLRTARDRS